MIVTVTPCSKKAFSSILEDVAMKNISGKAPRPPSFSPSSSTHSPVLCYAMVGLPAFILRGVIDFHKSVNSSAAVPYTWDNNNLASMRFFIVGI